MSNHHKKKLEQPQIIAILDLANNITKIHKTLLHNTPDKKKPRGTFLKIFKIENFIRVIKS